MEEILKIILSSVVGGGIGCLFFACGYGRYKNRRECSIPVKGIYVDVRTVVRNHTVYKYGIFEYQYAGQTYKHGSIDNIAGKAGRAFGVGQAYEIYVNPEQPQRFRCLQKLWTINDFVTMLLGLFFCGVTFLALIATIFL